jgi:DNA repair photolyase
MIVYPCCDGNTFDENFDTLLSSLLNVKNRIFVSISTKNKISKEQMKKLVETDKLLKSHNQGFLKISVSFSCRSMIERIEHGTLPYIERVSLIKSIVDCGLNSAANLKPLLPFIPAEEYMEIIDDIIPFANNFIIGGLYVNHNAKFFKDFIFEKYSVHEKPVSWIQDNPVWPYIEDKNTKDRICDHIRNMGGHFYDSDVDFISYINLNRGL